MRSVWNSVRKDLLRFRRDPVSIGTWFGIPLAIAVLMRVFLGGGGGAAPHGVLLVNDQDQSLFSQVLLGGFGQGPLAKMLTVERVSPADGERRIQRGEASAYLIIPEGFGRAFLDKKPVQLRLVTNPAQRIMPGIIEETLGIMIEGGYYAQELLAQPLAAISSRPPGGAPTFPDATIAGIAAAINARIRGVAAVINPPVIQLEQETAPSREPPFNFGAAFLPGMLFMAVMFVMEGLAGDIWKERMQGTLRRQNTTAGSLYGFLAGKVVVSAIVFLAIGLVGSALAHWAAAAAWSNVLPAALWVMFSGSALYLILLWIVMHASSERAANMLGNFIVLPLAMLGGCFFPFDFMPPGMAAIGKLTPNGWALMQFRDLLNGSAGGARIGLAALGLGLTGALAFWLAARRLRRGFAL